MAKDSQSLSENEKLILLSLLEDGRKPDTQIAKETGISQVTVNRVRRKLEEEKTLFGYLPLIDLGKIGADFFTIVLFQWKGYGDEKLTEKMLSDLEEDPNVVFLGVGEGFVYNVALFLGLSDFSEANHYLRDFRKKYEKQLGDMISFFMSGDNVVKQNYRDMVREYVKKQGEE